MQELTDEEREVLKEKYSDGYRFVARDGDGEVYAHSSKPVKGGLDWDGEGYYDWISDYVYSDFKFIKWEDDEPYEIEKLLDIKDDSI